MSQLKQPMPAQQRRVSCRPGAKTKVCPKCRTNILLHIKCVLLPSDRAAADAEIWLSLTQSTSAPIAGTDGYWGTAKPLWPSQLGSKEKPPRTLINR